MNNRNPGILQRYLARIKRQPRGQSFIELILVLMLLMMILAATTEFGFLLNNYLHVLDGAREAARYSSTSQVFEMNANGSIKTTPPTGGLENNNWPFYYITAAKAAITMNPVQLDPTFPDDIIVSAFAVSGNTLVRFPRSDPNGWSLCAHYANFAAYFPSVGAPVPAELSDTGWSSGCTVRTTNFSNADILARMDATAPHAGVLLVEIYYNYPQILKLPLLSNTEFFGVPISPIPDPIPLYLYTIMPISSAEPTQVP
jgi:hypothetical protein